MSNTVKIEEGLRHQYVERARAKQTSPDLRPAWVGQFWNDENMPQEMFRSPELEGQARSTCLIQLVRSAPYNEVVERAIEFRPGAREMLERWRLAWERSFPGFNDDPAWKHEKVGQSYVGWTLSRLNWHFDKGEKGLEVKPTKKNSLEATSLSEKAKFFAEVDHVAGHAKDDPRDSRLHIIDDADTVLSCASMMPGGVVLVHNGVAYQYTGNDQDGLPMFKDIGGNKQWLDNRLNDHPEYWFWPPFMKYMKRRSIFAANRETAAAIIADMAWQGETHAFLKGASSKSGTWTIDLAGIKTFQDADSKLTMLKATDASVVQEHLPFTHEQRFYIYNGKLMTSACSDRNFSRIDCREGKRLDDRIAVLKVPSINQGAFDRGITSHVVDRKTSAAFAREVRKIAAELKTYGILNYVVDMGVTERGIAAVEINTLHYAGPYCMDHRWQARAYTRARRNLLAHAHTRIVEAASGMIDHDPDITAALPFFVTELVCRNLLEQQAKRPFEPIAGRPSTYPRDDDQCTNEIAAAILTKVLLHDLATAELQEAA
jgi:hypothetical protein